MSGTTLGTGETDVLRRVVTAARTAVRAVFDPARETGASADDSSIRGGWRNLRGDTGEELASHEEYLDCMKDALAQALPDVLPEKLQELRQTTRFQEIFAPDWERKTSGHPANSRMMLTGEDLEQEELFDANAPAIKKLSQPKKAEKFLASMVQAAGASGEETVTLNMPGHALRSLAKHPSLDGLKGGDIERKVAEVFERTKNGKFDEDRVAAFAAKANAAFSTKFFGGNGADLASPEKLPKGAKNLAEIRAAIVSGVQPFIRQLAEVSLEANQHNPALNSLDKLTASFNEFVSVELDRLVVEDLFADAHFVLTDTNWGHGKDIAVQVVAPHPVTGEATLWQKKLFDGEMTPIGEKISQGAWSFLKVAA